tara:strand:+ start:1398 stop:2696 length:1299 start_codon:yes stop_codon:yes gene_type:complete
MSEVSKFYKIAKNELFRLNRSITGEGLKKTLKIYKKNFPELKIKSIRSGKKVFDWKVPPEWNIKNAYIMDKDHKMIVNFKENNLHLVGYSKPINKIIKKKELFKKLHSLKNQPSAIPYVTSYYKKDWGFCISHNKKKKLDKIYKPNDEFKVVIDSSFNKNGKLNYGELAIKGNTKNEILISTYICHPSMANNELSGSIVSLSLIDFFKKKKLDKSLRFIFIPETIGSIAYISKNLRDLKNNFIGGYNLSCIGDEKNYSCILSKYENTHVDYSLIEAFKNLGIKYKKFSFLKRGSDERQFNHPGVDFPMATICRSKFFEYPEYHTSLDNFHLVTEKGLEGGYKVAKEAIKILMKKIIPKSITICEPNMGKRGLYNKLSIKTNYGNKNSTKNFLSFLQYSDGKNDLNQISKYLNLKVSEVEKIYSILKKKKLVR